MAQNTARPGGSAIDGRTTRNEGYAQSINARRGIEKVFGLIKVFGGLRQFNLRGQENVSAVFGLQVIAYNLIPLGNLLKPTWDRQLAQAHLGGGMNTQLSRGVAKRRAIRARRRADSNRIGLSE